jgi:tetratricopeptide (TPR) repeat protein
VLRHAFAGHGEVGVDTQGDAFFVAFADAKGALAAAREAQQALAGDPLRVRMGLHTGEPLLTEAGYVGADVHKAARICSAGHGGQIVLSEETKLAVGEGDLRPLGLHRLKDLTAAEPLLEESLALFRRTGSRRGEAEAIGSLGHLAKDDGDVARALELYEQSAELVAPPGFTWWQLNMLGAIAECELDLGRVVEAEAPARESLAPAGEINDRQGIVYALALLASVAAEKHDLARAGRLWGALEAEEERGPIGQWESERETYAARVLARRGPELERSRQEGRRLSLKAAINDALEAS